LAEGAKLVPFPASRRSRDAGGGEGGLDSPPSIALETWVGEWSCGCGQRYRVLVEPLTFWPRNFARRFRTEPADECVSCGAQLDDAFALDAARIVLHLRAAL
jgi:hypothetical protein